MSQEKVVEAVRQHLEVQERSGRTLDQRLLVRFPWLVGLWSRLTVRLPPRSRLRQASLLRALQGGLEAYNRGDVEVAMLGYHPEVQIHQPPQWSDLGELGLQPIYRGHEGFRQWTIDWLGAWGSYRYYSGELIDLGDRFLVLIDMALRGKGSGVSVTERVAVLSTLHDDGRVIHEQRYTDPAEALEAVGLRE